MILKTNSITSPLTFSVFNFLSTFFPRLLLYVFIFLCLSYSLHPFISTFTLFLISLFRNFSVLPLTNFHISFTNSPFMILFFIFYSVFTFQANNIPFSEETNTQSLGVYLFVCLFTHSFIHSLLF